MTSNGIVVRVVAELDRLVVPYMLVGSYSSNAFGIPRSTQDADFVIEASDRPMAALFRSLADVLSFDPQMRLETVTMTSRFVGRDPGSGFKVELFLTTDDPHDQARFTRRRKYPFLTTEAFLPTPEDVLVQKLRWYHLGRRAKDLDDARSVLAVQAAHLDLAYIRTWADQHGTRELLDRLAAEVQNGGSDA